MMLIFSNEENWKMKTEQLYHHKNQILIHSLIHSAIVNAYFNVPEPTILLFT